LPSERPRTAPQESVREQLRQLGGFRRWVRQRMMAR
jgi:hypothetical protein